MYTMFQDVKELIGNVAVDSGQLLVCDPCYIDSHWEQEPFEDIRIYRHKTTGDTLQYLKDFDKYTDIIPGYNLSMNQLNETGDWEAVEDTTKPAHEFSYNACAKLTLSDQGHGELNFVNGFPGIGVAFRTAFGDGIYPVYAIYDGNGDLKKVEIVFDEDPEEYD